jgi:putative membrane protein
MVIGWRDRWPYPLGVPQADFEGAGAARAGRRHEEMVAMMFLNSGWAWWQAGLMWLAMIAFWVLLIWLIYALVTGVVGRGRQPEGGGDQRSGEAGRILDERLARGEIDLEEYQRLRDVLAGRGHSHSGAGSGQ